MMYELLTINAGEINVLYASDDAEEIRRKYQRAYNPRIRVDGQIMSINDADRFVGGKSVFFEAPIRGAKRPVCLIDADGNVLVRYPSVTAAAEAHNCNFTTVRKSCMLGRTTRTGKRFKYMEE